MFLELHIQAMLLQRVIKFLIVIALGFGGTSARAGCEVPVLGPTDNFIIRPLAEKDFPVLAKMLRKKEVTDTLLWSNYKFREGHLDEYASHDFNYLGNNFEKSNKFTWAILTPKGQVVGFVSLRLSPGIKHHITKNITEDKRRFFEDHLSEEKQRFFSISYAVDPGSWGQGYASKAVQAALRFAVEYLKPDGIVGAVDVNNPASANVLTKAGFQLVVENFSYNPGTTDNLYVLFPEAFPPK